MNGMENITVLHPKVEIHGFCARQFEQVRDAFRNNLDTGQDIGASVAVCIDGEVVVDLWGGYFDGTFSRPFEADTIVQGYSSTKTVTALCALVLADRGEIDLDAPVAKYWPEFAAAGKSGILVRQLLGHTAGLCGWAEPMTFRDLYDWEKGTTLLARQAPLWEPGRTSGYHGYTQGHLVGEVIRRVTGVTIGRFLSDEIAKPLGVGELYYIGTPKEADERVSLLIQGAPQDAANGNRLHDLALYNPHPTPQDTWTVEWRRAELPAMNGHGSAKAIAVMQSILAAGGANGRSLISDEGRARLLEQQSDGADLVIDVPCKWGMGFSMETVHFPEVPQRTRAAWWAGNGGSMSFVDLDARLSFGYTPNRWISGPFEQARSRNVLGAVYRALEGMK